MVREIRNLKGEVIGETDRSDSEESGIVSSQALVLIGGSVLLLLGIFPGFFSSFLGKGERIEEAPRF